ncbi:F-box/LRR-repeat protein 4-like [Aphidius gifuensis]|uniref:F-box/LRR-repeat protein 4-like n=1 Tax=Aphidius gifuensis TaxID=684658 RepID=UPI001CDB8603|nr:F-box/LRR-repeat protein 4-like [Aphidius gifuensis]
MPDLANTIVQYCKNLKDLRIHHPYHYMSDAALKKLTELVNLECLILLGCIKLSKESIIVISNNCKKLKRLEVPGCFIVPFAFLDEFSKLQYLEHLNLFGTLNLKSSAITAIANNCKNLKILQIQDCNVITEAALVAITKLENLQKLDISFIDIITDSFLIKLKGLKELHCNGCKKLTKVGIIELIKNNPDLDVIDVRLIGKIKIDFVIDADQVTKSRTNGIILHIKISNPSIIQASKSIIKSQWLVVEDI